MAENLHRGIVVSNADPEGKGRVRLRVPSVFGQTVTGWAPSILGGTVPAAGDIVWVTFEAGDGSRPAYFPPDHEHPHDHSTETWFSSHDHVHNHDAAYVNESDHTKAQHTALGLADAANANATFFDPGPVTTPTSSYPAGLSYASVLVGDGWPATGTLFTVRRHADSRFYQELVDYTGTYRWWRNYHINTGFSGWQLLGPEYGPKFPDTRSTNPTPQQFKDMVPSVGYNSRWDFKSGSAIGLPSSYYGVHTIAPWGDDSGGGMHQIAHGPDHIYSRYGTRASGWTTTWRRLRQDGWDLLLNHYLSANWAGTFDLSWASGYSQIRIIIPWIRHTSGTTNAHVYARLNGDATNMYAGNLFYYSTGAESATTYSASAQAYLAYSYFYGNSYGGASFEINIRAGGARCYIESDWWNAIGSGGNSNGYGYGGRCKSGWHNGAGEITRFQMWNSGSLTWEAGSRILVYGKRQ